MKNFNYKNFTILVVDDNPANLGVITDYLAVCEFRILISREGKDAITKARRYNPDIILLDVMMPGIDGFETCRYLKDNEETKEIPVIFMTALANESDKMKGFDVGGVDYITKPVMQGEVIARIRTHLTIRQQKLSLQEAYGRLQNEMRIREKSAIQLNYIARMAGMAEVTGNVLHHVGNALNSINNLTQKVTDHFRNVSMTDNFDKAISALKARAQQPDSKIFTPNKLVEYLEALKEKMKTHTASMKDDVYELGRITDELKNILNQQRDRTVIMETPEHVSPAEIINFAIDINRYLLKKERINLITHIDTLPDIRTSKHTLLQIIADMIHYSCMFMQSIGTPDETLALNAKSSKNGAVEIEIRYPVGSIRDNDTAKNQKSLLDKLTNQYHDIFFLAKKVNGNLTVTPMENEIIISLLVHNPETPSQSSINRFEI